MRSRMRVGTLMAVLMTIMLAGAGCSRAADGEALFVARDLTAPGSFTRGAEGPAVDAEGNIYAVNFERQGTIGRITPAGEGSVFVELPEGSIGNGIRFDSRGDMLVADYNAHNVLRIDMATRAVSVLVHVPAMNQPNDLAITSGDIIFASDPNFRERSGQFWRIERDGRPVLLETGMGTTNGIEVSPGEDRLYVGESRQGNIWAYDLSPMGEISNKRLLHHFDDFGLDGIRTDIAGRLYVTRQNKGTVAILSPEGELVREVALTGLKPSNIAFGGPDGRTCYVTMQDRGCIETFRTDTPGRAWVMMHGRQ